MDLHSMMQATLNKNRTLRESWSYYTVVTDNVYEGSGYTGRNTFMRKLFTTVHFQTSFLMNQ